MSFNFKAVAYLLGMLQDVDGCFVRLYKRGVRCTKL